MNKKKVVMYAGVLLAIAALVSIGSASSIGKNSIENTIECTIDRTIDSTIENTVEYTIEGTIDSTIENTIENTVEYTIECIIKEPSTDIDEDKLLTDLQDYETIFYENGNYRSSSGGCNRIYDVNRNEIINFQDAGLCWRYAIDHDNRTFYGDLLYDVNMDGRVNFQDAGLIWVNRD